MAETHLRHRLSLPEVRDERPSEPRLKLLLGVAALMTLSLGVVAGSPVVLGCGASLVGLLILSRLMIDVRGGVTSSNWGTWRRAENPVGFACNVYFWGLITLLSFAFGGLAMLGFIRFPAP